MTEAMNRDTRPEKAMDRTPTPGPTAVKILRVQLQALFGLYNYDIPGTAGVLDRTPLLYGENGLGKTNILKILFHLLSPAPDRGHRTALAAIRFRKIEVALSNSVIVRAFRQGDALDGAMRLEVTRHTGGSDVMVGAWNWYPKGTQVGDASQRWLAHLDPAVAQAIAKPQSGAQRTKALQLVLADFLAKETDPLVSEAAFLKALRETVPPIYFLTADRTLNSDYVEQDVITSTAADPRRLRPDELMTKGREHALNRAIALASRHLSRTGLRAARQGSGSMHTIYRDLIKRLASRRSRKSPRVAQALETLTNRLLSLSSRYALYSTYGLAPQLDGQSLVSLLESVRPNERSVAVEVLTPYVESLTELAKGVDHAYELIDTFVSVVNGFLYDKTLEFTVGEGFVVRNRLQALLEPKDLSSGEQHLLLLFCHIALAHEAGGLFLIDEPEISLNVKWQRRLVDALLSLDTAKNLQFVLASHSIEILTKHRNSVVVLKEVVSE